jgi:hypothetical protein
MKTRMKLVRRPPAAKDQVCTFAHGCIERGEVECAAVAVIGVAARLERSCEIEPGKSNLVRSRSMQEIAQRTRADIGLPTCLTLAGTAGVRGSGAVGGSGSRAVCSPDERDLSRTSQAYRNLMTTIDVWGEAPGTINDAEFRMRHHSNPKYAFLTFGSDSSAEALSEKAMRPVSIT